MLQNHPDEDPGAIGLLLQASGLSLNPVEVDEGEEIPPLEDFDVMVVMGGPQHVWEEAEHPWLIGEKAAIRRWVAELERPFLGVCLGHQLLADAMGGTVRPMASPEIGVLDITVTPEGRADPVFGTLPAVVPGLQWHEAEVVEPPPGAAVLGVERPFDGPGAARRALAPGRRSSTSRSTRAPCRSGRACPSTSAP